MNDFRKDTDVRDLPEGVLYRVYPQPTPGLDTKGSSLVVLRSCESGEERYSVLYRLHGRMAPSCNAIGRCRITTRR
jgi:hypothetical protein